MIELLKRYASNITGWRTNRKIVVIESDDWGSIRMPSLRTFHELQKMGLNLTSGDNGRFNTLDTLESADDFSQLFDTLRSHRDAYGRHPVFTALSLCANPDFDRISKSAFSQYFFEPLDSTYERYDRPDVKKFWRMGHEEGILRAEFHGREHLNVKVWLDDLRKNNEQTMQAFRKGFWGFRNQAPHGISYQAAFDVDDSKSIEEQKGVLSSGINLFERFHGYKPRYFVPPNGAINQQIIDHSAKVGISYVSSPKVFYESLGNGKKKRHYRYIGKKGENGLIYLTRNCFFEPSFTGRGFSMTDCLQHIQVAFRLRKPAVISTHRVNYVGGLDHNNAVKGNEALNLLLKTLLKRWPEVEFMDSTTLGNLIKNDTH